MSDIASFIAQRLDEDEATARGAIDPNRPGTNWHWVTTHNDTPVIDGEEVQALDDGNHLSLRTSEEFPLSWDPPSTLPAFIIGADGGFPGSLRHIARHDPARVLRQVSAMRKIMAEHTDNSVGCSTCCTTDDDHWEAESKDWPCPTVRAIASTWDTHPDYRAEWTA